MANPLPAHPLEALVERTIENMTEPPKVTIPTGLVIYGEASSPFHITNRGEGPVLHRATPDAWDKAFFWMSLQVPEGLAQSHMTTIEQASSWSFPEMQPPEQAIRFDAHVEQGADSSHTIKVCIAEPTVDREPDFVVHCPQAATTALLQGKPLMELWSQGLSVDGDYGEALVWVAQSLTGDDT